MLCSKWNAGPAGLVAGLLASAAASIALVAPAFSQDVYKCGRSDYSQQPCAGRVVRTDEAPVATSPMQAKRREEQRLLAANLRRDPGESNADYGLRKRRARMLPEDSAECARLDTRMPVEQSRIENPDADERATAFWALKYSKTRFRELRC